MTFNSLWRWFEVLCKLNLSSKLHFIDFCLFIVFSNCYDLKIPLSQITQMANICPIRQCQQWQPNNSSWRSRTHTPLNRLHHTWCQVKMEVRSWQRCLLHKLIMACRHGFIQRAWFRSKELNQDGHWHHHKAQKINHLWVSFTLIFFASSTLQTLHINFVINALMMFRFKLKKKFFIKNSSSHSISSAMNDNLCTKCLLIISETERGRERERNM